ncbi:MAG: hypothetical protein ACYC5Y_10405 [Symbiobacteriia bacterium]
MTLSMAARLYLLWQIFDAVNRSAMTFDALEEQVPDLKSAWPDYRQQVLVDPRFIEVGGAIDVSTSGVHPSASVDEIIRETLIRAQRPMTDQDLGRIVRRLRPAYPSHRDPVEDAMRSGLFFRPRPLHLALRRSLQSTEALDLRPGEEDVPLEAAVSCIASAGGRVGAAALTAALALQFSVTPEAAYGVVASPELLLLPDGTVCLYDPVEDEISLASSGEPGQSDGGNAGNEEFTVPDELRNAMELPPDLVRQVVLLCRERRGPVTTEEIIARVLSLQPEDPRYLATVWSVRRDLQLSTEVLAVGEHQWYEVAAIPPAVFSPLRHPRGAGGSLEVRWEAGFRREGDWPKPSPGTHSDSPLLVTLSAGEIAAGCISDARLSRFFSDHPQIQMMAWNGHQAWFNADTFVLAGLGSWMRRERLHPGDGISIRRDGPSLTAIVEHRETAGHASEQPAPGVQVHWQSRSLLLAVGEFLANAGGSLTKEELLALLQQEDPWLEWADIAPLFKRYPSLELTGELCSLTRTAGKPNKGGARRAEILGMLAEAEKFEQEVASAPVLSNLIGLAAAGPRISPEREGLLIAEAQAAAACSAYDTPAMSEIVRGNMRRLMHYLLASADLEEMLPYLEDYFQAGCLGIVKAAARFDRSKGNWLGNILYFYFMSEVDREKHRFAGPVYFPFHVLGAVN